VSVSRAIKPYAETNHPQEWFHQKNCVHQYYDMLEHLEQPKRKRGDQKGDKSESDTPSLQIMRKMTIERSEQLKKEIMEMQQDFRKMQQEVEDIDADNWDEKKLQEEWEKMKEDDLLSEDSEQVSVKDEDLDEDIKAQRKGADLDMSELLSVTGDLDDTAHESTDNISMTDEDSQPGQFLTSTPSVPTTPTLESGVKAGPSAPDLLASLLKSNLKSAMGLQQFKKEQEQSDVSLLTNLKTEDQSIGSPGWPEDASSKVCDEAVGDTVELTEVVEEEILVEEGGEDMVVAEEVVTSEVPVQDVPVQEVEEVTIELTSKVKEEDVKEDEAPLKPPEEPPVPDIKDEPLSPCSSISSRLSEGGAKHGGRGKGRSKPIRSPRMGIRKSLADDASSRHSDLELSDMDDVRENEDNDMLMASAHGSMLGESVPNSPASLSICSDTEEEKAFKNWKKSIMMVWRAASTHKFASVFTNPVTDEIAPGYHSVIKRPMDLSTIKKNLDNGNIRTTPEFQRDIMLMFTNAIMYNHEGHNVNGMAKTMYNDVLKHIEQYVNTQMMVQSSDNKPVRQSRRSEVSDIKCPLERAVALKERQMNKLG